MLLLAAIAVPVHGAAARGDGGAVLTGGAAAPTPPATGDASAHGREAAPVPAPAPVSGGALAPAPEQPSQPLPEPPSAPEPQSAPKSPSALEPPTLKGADPPRKPEPKGMGDRIALDGVPALVARHQLAGAAAVVPSGGEPPLVQVARVRDEPKGGGADVEVPLDGERPAQPAPRATARPPELPRTGLDVAPLAAMGTAMLIAGLVLMQVLSLTLKGAANGEGP